MRPAETPAATPLYARLFGYGTRRGVASMTLGMAAFVINDTLIKLASTTTPTGQLITMRNIVSVTAILLLILVTGQAAQLRRMADRVVIARSTLDIIATILYLIALFNIPIGNVTAINMATPLAMTAAAAIFLRTQVGWRRWSAVAIGFAGVLLIVQPRAEGFNAYSLFAIGSILFILSRDLTTRRIDQSIPSLVIALANAIFVLAGALTLSAFEGWAPVSWRECLLLACAGLFLVLGYLLIVDAFRHGDLATVGPFRYTGLIFALVSGYMVWGDIPNLLAWAGIVIVVGSGLYVLHRERVRAQDEATRSMPVE